MQNNMAFSFRLTVVLLSSSYESMVFPCYGDVLYVSHTTVNVNNNKGKTVLVATSCPKKTSLRMWSLCSLCAEIPSEYSVQRLPSCYWTYSSVENICDSEKNEESCEIQRERVCLLGRWAATSIIEPRWFVMSKTASLWSLYSIPPGTYIDVNVRVTDMTDDQRNLECGLSECSESSSFSSWLVSSKTSLIQDEHSSISRTSLWLQVIDDSIVKDDTYEADVTQLFIITNFSECMSSYLQYHICVGDFIRVQHVLYKGVLPLAPCHTCTNQCVQAYYFLDAFKASVLRLPALFLHE